MIKLNGYACIDGKDMYFEDFEIEIIEDGFDCEIEEYEMDCDECGFCDLDEEDYDEEFWGDDEDYEDYEDDLDDNVDALLEMYADILGEGCGCEECQKEILANFLRDAINLLINE